MRAPITIHTPKTIERLSDNSLPKVPSSEEPKLVEVDLNELIQKMLGEEPQEVNSKDATRSLNTKEAVQTVKSILTEYFDAYMLMGYGVDGKRTIIRDSKSDQDDDSLFELLRYVFMRSMQQGS